jgi:hypothetical protein
MNCVAALNDFAAYPPRRLESQQRVREGMVSDRVSALGNLGGNTGTLAHVAANQKERSLNVIPGKNIEQMESVRVVRPVVEGQRNLLRTSLPSAESPPKPLPSRGQRLVSSSGHPDDGSTGDRKSKHAAILNA